MDPTGTETVRWAYPPLPASATNARHRLAAQLVTWKIGEPETEPVFLIAYELMANAIPDFRRSQAHEGLIDRVGAGQGGAVRP
jgi:hypothetical protein